MCETGNRRAPEDVLARLAVPLVRQILSFGDTGPRLDHETMASFLCCFRAGERVVLPLPVPDDLARRFGDSSSAGRQVLRSKIICRGLHSSETRLNERCLPSVS
jgi:hypothetical protein